MPPFSEPNPRHKHLLIFPPQNHQRAARSLLFLLSFLLGLIPAMQAETTILPLLEQADALSQQSPDSAQQLAKQALELAEIQAEDSLRGEAWLIIGRLAHRQVNLKEATWAFQQALDIFDRLGATRGMIRAFSGLGITARKAGDHPGALMYFRQGLELAQKEADLKAQLLTNLGTLHGRLQETELAIRYFLEAKVLREQQGDSLGLAILANNLGNLYYLEQDFGLAEGAYLEALLIYQELGDQRRLGHTNGNLGNLAVIDENWKLAAEYYQAGLKIAEIQQDPLAQVQIGTELAMVWEMMDQSSKAQQLWNRLLPMTRELGDAETETELLRYLSESMFLNGQAQTAYELLQQAHDLGDSLQATYNEERIAELSLQYDMERKERELAESRLDLEQARHRQYLLGASLIVVLIVLLMVAMRMRDHQRQRVVQQELHFQREELNRQVVLDLLKAQEVESLNAMLIGKDQERQRIAADLHDSLGGTLAAVKVSLFTLRKKMDPIPPETDQAYEHTRVLLEEAYREVRRISHDLADVHIHHQGLAKALHSLCETMEEHSGHHLQWEIGSLEDLRMDSQAEVQIYRIVQELFHNIIKHAKANRVSLQASLHRDRLNILVEDNGVGFEYDPVNDSPGIGLTTIQQRVRQLKGTVEIDSEPGQGTTVILDVPR
ncbi:MAG: sensor histidine kinase [Bacteroidota bacterium]